MVLRDWSKHLQPGNLAYGECHLAVNLLQHVLLPLSAAVLALLPLAALANPPAGGGAVPALYATKAEAEKAARLHFNCTGAHRMGQQWMPCAQHRPGQPASSHSH